MMCAVRDGDSWLSVARMNAGEVHESYEIVESVGDHRGNEVVEGEREPTEKEADRDGEEEVQSREGVSDAEEETRDDERDDGRRPIRHGILNCAAEEQLFADAGEQGDHGELQRAAVGEHFADHALDLFAEFAERCSARGGEPAEDGKHRHGGGEAAEYGLAKFGAERCDLFTERDVENRSQNDSAEGEAALDDDGHRKTIRTFSSVVHIRRFSSRHAAAVSTVPGTPSP